MRHLNNYISIVTIRVSVISVLKMLLLATLACVLKIVTPTSPPFYPTSHPSYPTPHPSYPTPVQELSWSDRIPDTTKTFECEDILTCLPPSSTLHCAVHPHTPVQVGKVFTLGCLPDYCADGGEVAVTCTAQIARYGYTEEEEKVTCRKEKPGAVLGSEVSCLHDKHVKLGFKLSSNLIKWSREKVSTGAHTVPATPLSASSQPTPDMKLPRSYRRFTAVVDCNVCLDRICGKMFQQHGKRIIDISGSAHIAVGCAVNARTRVGVCEYAYA